jgi:non-ribosomal peptide synthetase component F
MMGFFADIGPLRTRVSSELSFVELLRQVRDTVLNAQAHEDMPFDLVSEELKRDGQAPPDIRAIFMVESSSGHPHSLPGLEVKTLRVEIRKAMPWRFQMRVRDGGAAFSGRAKFDARLHDPQLVRRMVRNYVRLLNAVVAKPALRLCDVEDELGGW